LNKKILIMAFAATLAFFTQTKAMEKNEMPESELFEWVKAIRMVQNAFQPDDSEEPPPLNLSADQEEEHSSKNQPSG